MSDVPQRSGPDLHALFGIDGEPGGRVDADVELDRYAAAGPNVEIDAGGRADAQREIEATNPPLVRLGAEVEGAIENPAIKLESSGGGPDRDEDDPRGEAGDSPPADGGDEWSGITRPSRRGSSQRFLTDVIVDMGIASRGQVEEALESSRIAGTTPERVLLEKGTISPDGLARALAERYGLDHLDLGIFSVDMAAANLVTTAIAKRYQAVPVAFSDKRTLLVAMADPSNVLAVDDIAIMTGYEVRVAVAPPDGIAALVSRLDRLEEVVGTPEQQLEEEDGAEVVALHET